MISQYFWSELLEWMILVLIKVGKTKKGNSFECGGLGVPFLSSRSLKWI